MTFKLYVGLCVLISVFFVMYSSQCIQCGNFRVVFACPFSVYKLLHDLISSIFFLVIFLIWRRLQIKTGREFGKSLVYS